MNTDLLRTFLAVVELGSFSAAAERLQTQVSTVSRRVTELEAEVAADLLVRGGRGVRTSPGGELFAERARHVLAELERAVAVARGEAEAGPAHLRVSAPLELGLTLVPDVVASVSRAFPGLTLHVHSDARRVSLVEEDFDAAIRLGKLEPSELIGRSLGSISMVAVCHPARTLERHSQIATTRFVSPAGARRSIAATWGKRAVRLGSPDGPTVGTFTEAAELATRLELATVLPSYTAARFVRDRRLVLLNPKIRVGRVPLHLLLPQRHRRNRPLIMLGEELKGALERAEHELRDLQGSP